MDHSKNSGNSQHDSNLLKLCRICFHLLSKKVTPNLNFKIWSKTLFLSILQMIKTILTLKAFVKNVTWELKWLKHDPPQPQLKPLVIGLSTTKALAKCAIRLNRVNVSITMNGMLQIFKFSHYAIKYFYGLIVS